MGMQKEEGISLIKKAIAESLFLDENSIQENSKLKPDLGVNSLDFIDIIFSLEKAFSISLKETDFDFAYNMEGKSTTDMGFLTDEAIKKLIPIFPELKDMKKVHSNQLFSMMDVGTLWLVVERKLKNTND